jgi:hypothetical protein
LRLKILHKWYAPCSSFSITFSPAQCNSCTPMAAVPKFSLPALRLTGRAYRREASGNVNLTNVLGAWPPIAHRMPSAVLGISTRVLHDLDDPRVHAELRFQITERRRGQRFRARDGAIGKKNRSSTRKLRKPAARWAARPEAM